MIKTIPFPSNYINSLVGLPFMENGRDGDAGLDCYGLLLKVYKDLFDLDLPDWQTEKTAREVAEQIREGLEGKIIEGFAKEVPLAERVNWDVVVVRRVALPYHLGLCVYNGVLHASRGTGVIFQTLGRFEADHGAGVKVYRWQP